MSCVDGPVCFLWVVLFLVFFVVVFFLYFGEGGRMCIRYCGTGIAVVEVLRSCVTPVLPPDSRTVYDTASGLSCH